MKRIFLLIILLGSFLFPSPLGEGLGVRLLLAQVRLDFDMGSRGQKVTEDHYGIFYEEINHAGDGGLYAELIQNRSFEDNAGNPDKWWTVGNASVSMATDNMLNMVQEHALRLKINASGGGVRNEGF